MLISVDVDITLVEIQQVQNLIKLLDHARRNMPLGYKHIQLAIITDRDKDEWESSYQFKKFLDEFGMTMRDVYFTEGRSKFELVSEMGCDMHIDYNMEVVDEINRLLPGKAWLVNFTKERAYEYINKV